MNLLDAVLIEGIQDLDLNGQFHVAELLCQENPLSQGVEDKVKDDI